MNPLGAVAPADGMPPSSCWRTGYGGTMASSRRSVGRGRRPASRVAGHEKEKAAALLAMDKARQAEKAERSFIGRIGKVFAPLFEPLGIDWRGGVALLTGFVAKEIVVSTLGVLHAVGDEEDPEALKNALQATGMTPLSALSMMVFVLLYLSLSIHL